MDTLRATGQIYHAKNLHSARSTSKAKGTEFQGASGHRERGGMNTRCTFVSRSDRNWRGVFKMRDLADLGQSSSSVNTTALPQSSKTEQNHNIERRNAEKGKMGGKTTKLRGDWRHFSLLSWEVKESEQQKEREIEDRDMTRATRPSCVV